MVYTICWKTKFRGKLNANLVRKWVRQRPGLPKSGAKLLPVAVELGATQGISESSVARAPGGTEGGSIEIRMGRIELVVRGRVDRDQLSVVLDTLVRVR